MYVFRCAMKLFCTFVMISVFLGSHGQSCIAQKLHLDKIKLPRGFTIGVYAEKVPGARSLVLGPEGIVFVGTRDEGKVYALLAGSDPTRAGEIITVAKGLHSPNGVAVRDNALYVSEINRILRFDDINSRLRNFPQPVVINDSFPSERAHGWKFIAFGPDGKLYVPVGAPCNICNPEDKRFASIMRMNPDGSQLEIFAHGIRNTVGFDWHPVTKELWFTDNGRDWMGDNEPPDELNCAPEKGLHFGFPYCHGGTVPDPEFGRVRSCKEFVAPRLLLGPHVAALGMRFYTGNSFPEEYRNQIFIAEHGSWNRSKKIGYRITLARGQGKDLKYEVFAEGWLQGQSEWGRPVDVLVMPDGALLVSDDSAGVVYRIQYGAP